MSLQSGNSHCFAFQIAASAAAAGGLRRKRRAFGMMAATLSQPDHWMNASC
ncbi:MAG TPA: hypothetical protein VE092_22300 [Herbaspirillum sp.]|uniref:hypothetical protein n=1 Tax=Herbaspirillum sp. TaxID=1890675 RepID=UPI002D40290A|nr:hypothetical protein [Herbaspirillum sp.]HZG22752.1 hypothetical protein [Herbaspirillum sp.]